MADSVNDLPITLELNVNKVNVILRSLGKHPFDEINELIADIKKQGEYQIQLWAKKLEEYQAEQNAKNDVEEDVTASPLDEIESIIEEEFT